MHLASWTKQNQSFILFPLASSNFETYMRSHRRPRLDRDFVQWLLEQIAGLADALAKLHGPPLCRTDVSDGTDLNNPIRVGFNHDLKPANILMFEDRDGTILKWCDFGSGRISTVIRDVDSSPCTSNPGTGDPAYSPPELLTKGTSSRPKDIWSFGCILLEILLWALDIEPFSDLDWFKQERRKTPTGSDQGLSAFWYQDPATKTIVFKEPVVKSIEELRGCCEKDDIFGSLLELVLHMMNVEQRQRPTAEQITLALVKMSNDGKTEKESVTKQT